MKTICKRCGKRYHDIEAREQGAEYVCERCGGTDHFILDRLDSHVYDLVSILIEKGFPINNFCAPTFHTDFGTELVIVFDHPFVSFDFLEGIPEGGSKLLEPYGCMTLPKLVYSPGSCDRKAYVKMLNICNKLRKWAYNLPVNEIKKGEK